MCLARIRKCSWLLVEKVSKISINPAARLFQPPLLLQVTKFSLFIKTIRVIRVGVRIRACLLWLGFSLNGSILHCLREFPSITSLYYKKVQKWLMRLHVLLQILILFPRWTTFHVFHFSLRNSYLQNGIELVI